MSARIAFAGLAALFALTGAARAANSFDYIQQICVANHADPAAALATADQGGWMPAPAALMDRFPKEQFSQAEGRIRSSAGGMYVLIVAKGDMAGSEKMHVRLCAIAAIPSEADAVTAAEALAAVPQGKCGVEVCYVWREDNGVHVQVERDSPDAKTLAQAGALTFLLVKSEEKMSMIMLAVPQQ